jgi:hypothetical protein
VEHPELAPVKILFGNRARGDARPESEKKGFAVDLVVAHPSDLERYQGTWMTIYPEALREGKVRHAA